MPVRARKFNYREDRMNIIFHHAGARRSALLLILFISFLTLACGSHSGAGGPAAVFPEGSVTTEEVEEALKFDARVAGHEVEGNKLIVEVNDSWMSSPPGLHERSLGKWFGMWQAAHNGSAEKQQKGVEVVARFEGREVARWTAEGYKWLGEPESEQAKSE
jgi:hypothetical protein